MVQKECEQWTRSGVRNIEGTGIRSRRLSVALSPFLPSQLLAGAFGGALARMTICAALCLPQLNNA